MVLNAAVQMLREADELKQKISKFKSGTSMLQERSLWVTQQQLQKVYQKVLVLDLDYALDKKVEQDLWNVGFKQQIEALQAISKDRKNPLRSEGQAMLSWVLQAAAGFYLCLLHQICTTFKLDLPFRRRASLLGWVEGWGAGEAAGGARLPPPAAARYICQHCLVHLGDLARYRQQLRVAHTFYRHALVVSAHSGQPYNQLALVAWRRGRRLGALYWHVRSLLVRAPFPPAPANLARTLHAAASGGLSSLPVLPGVTGAGAAAGGGAEPAPPARLDAHAYVTELIRAMHMIHSVEQLETAATIVKSLNSSLTALIATDSFESMTLVKMSVVIIWLVQSANEEWAHGALSGAEAAAAALADELGAALLLHALLPACTLPDPPPRALPALKVLLSWVTGSGAGLTRSAAWAARAALLPALAHALTRLAAMYHQPADNMDPDTYEHAPLPEDEELHGFLPLEEAMKPLRFDHAAWDTYGGRVPDVPEPRPGDDERGRGVGSALGAGAGELQQRVRAHRLVRLGQALARMLPDQLTYTDARGRGVGSALGAGAGELQQRVRAHRLVRLGQALARMLPDQLTYTDATEEEPVVFRAAHVGGEQLAAALAELARVRAAPGAEPHDDSDDEPQPPPPPIVISEADFREKVREKRAGILKPQGSLERAREERAAATTADKSTFQEVEAAEEQSKGEDKKEARKPRVNIAMAAIMRKQEETNKQVKFVTPPPTPESSTDTAETKEQDKPKVIQPKPMKGLASLPLGRKTGGILSLKDKSAGYPHLVNTDPEPVKKPEKEEKKEPKPQISSQNSQTYSQSSQNYPQKRQEVPASPKWAPAAPQYEGPRAAFQKSYGAPPGAAYSPAYAPPAPGIRLPVVNPKEIDVRTAALQKQNSRQDLLQEGHKFGNYNYQMSGDKKNFLNDLPPRFANQYRYWQQDDKRDEYAKPGAFAAWPAAEPPPPWWPPPEPAPYAQPYYSRPAYAPAFAPAPPKDGLLAAPYAAVPQPQLQTLQSMVSSPNFSSSLNSFGSYPSVGYDAGMYPQFGKGYPPPKPGFADADARFPDAPRRPMTFNDPLASDHGGISNLDQSGNGPVSVGAGAAAGGSTYSLFSGAPDSAWGAASQHHPNQSLWSGPGPSPLERLLEQQKQMKPQ